MGNRDHEMTGGTFAEPWLTHKLKYDYDYESDPAGIILVAFTFARMFDRENILNRKTDHEIMTWGIFAERSFTSINWSYIVT